MSVQPVNLGEIGEGPIPITTLIDASGQAIINDELHQAQERTRLLKQAVATLTGDRNPLPVSHTPSKSPKATEYGNLNRSPSGKNIGQGQKTVLNSTIPDTIKLDPNVMNPGFEADKGRKSPFQQTSKPSVGPIKEPVV